MFDLTRCSSFVDLIEWRDDVEKVIGQKSSLLAGTKLDLAREGKREVSAQEGEALMSELHVFKYFETSAKDGNSVEDVFTLLTLEILKSSGKI